MDEALSVKSGDGANWTRLLRPPAFAGVLAMTGQLNVSTGRRLKAS